MIVQMCWLFVVNFVDITKNVCKEIGVQDFCYWNAMFSFVTAFIFQVKKCASHNNEDWRENATASQKQKLNFKAQSNTYLIWCNSNVE